MEENDGTAPERPWVAIMVSRATHDDGTQDLWREDIVLLHAPDPQRALQRARERGEAAGSSQVVDGTTVTWALEQVVDVSPLPPPRPGRDGDLYSRTFRDREAYQRFESLADPVPGGAGPAAGPG